MLPHLESRGMKSFSLFCCVVISFSYHVYDWTSGPLALVCALSHCGVEPNRNQLSSAMARQRIDVFYLEKNSAG